MMPLQRWSSHEPEGCLVTRLRGVGHVPRGREWRSGRRGEVKL